MTLVMLLACTTSPVPGSEGGSCEPSCNPSLICVDDLCRSPTPLPSDTVNQLLGSQKEKLDILVVLDNTHGSESLRKGLADNFERLLEPLRDSMDIHLGVVSSDIGTGSVGSSCELPGDDGKLVLAEECGVTGSFLQLDRASDSGNFTGELASSLSCMAQLGILGCPFEQPFESMRRALTPAANSGFVRDDASLAILILSDEDDCSTKDPGMFDDAPELSSIDGLPGPLGSFRCFEFGVECDEDLSARELGPRTNCRAKEDSSFMYGATEYIRFVQERKGPNEQVFLASIYGGAPVVIESANDEFRTESCNASIDFEVQATPRIETLVRGLSMPEHPICQGETITNSIASIAADMEAMFGSCLMNQATIEECTIADVRDFGGDLEHLVAELPLCADTNSGACYLLSEGCSGGTKVSINRRDTLAAANTVVVASCGG